MTAEPLTLLGRSYHDSYYGNCKSGFGLYGVNIPSANFWPSQSLGTSLLRLPVAAINYKVLAPIGPDDPSNNVIAF
jgi:hypothetical protein